MQNDPLNTSDPTGRDGVTFSVEGWNTGDRDMVTGEPLPPAYTGLGIAAGFNDNGDFEIGGFISHAEGEDVTGGGFGALAGPGAYLGDISDMERTTHTGIGAIGPEGGSATVLMENGTLGSDAAAISIPRVRYSVGIGLGGAVARTTTDTASTVVITREQIEGAREAVNRAVGVTERAAGQTSEFVRTLPDRIREGLGRPVSPTGSRLRRQ